MYSPGGHFVAIKGALCFFNQDFAKKCLLRRIFPAPFYPFGSLGGFKIIDYEPLTLIVLQRLFTAC